MMNKKIIFVIIALLLIGSLMVVTAKQNKVKLIPFFSHCSCSYICVPKGEVVIDCSRECPTPVSLDGSKIKIKMINCNKLQK